MSYLSRKKFIHTSMLAAGSMALFGKNLQTTHTQQSVQGKYKFKLDYAPHFGMFENSAGKDVIDQLKFMADQGFTSLEDNGMPSKPIEQQTKIGETMAKLNMRMGVFVVNMDTAWSPTLTTGSAESRDKFIQSCKAAVEVAKRVNAKWMTVVPGFYKRDMPIGYQTANVVETLRRGAEIFEPHGLVMVLEPLSDTPELFLRYSDQTFEICKAVKSPSCKILFDIYHMQRNEGNIINNIEKSWDEIAYFQIGDNPGRNEPTSGEVNYKNIFKYIKNKGYTGILGMEHGNAKPGKEGESALIEAYKWSDSF
ncbi:MAG: TIM barrel protein [Cytophagales bacterium]|nr:TIM barrel protein [Cytophagales bacterium]